MEQRPIKTNEHGIRNLRDAGRHIRHRQKRTKCDLACVVHHFISEDTGPYLRGTAVTTDQDITCICFPVCERRRNMIRILHESLEAMVEEHAIGIVSKYGIGQRGVKIGAMNLMIGSAESLDVISSVRPDFYYLACSEMAYQVGLGGPGFFRDPFANAKKVERVHRILRDNHTCTDLSKFPRLLEHRNAIPEML
jgi:hypothetical protein